ncbi:MULTISPECIES: MurR/RpiR family transcriptional regulator [unclassified Streptomyces]|uniref:MurR/RpiR family transcriptional regulator n=1 Tax=unclassified Streptomyces TaxID=2593676 RepID=UPI0006AD85FA|nr:MULTISPECIES: MurR/RpiR family transcriptional regulator [unclassified Streptomyces]KOX23330.1 RpiR family transcriptional regulator [Streptomyces sp. NRRL F-6491]KOX42716.1 RpiR family transcriptional regulator [Streptomyces sp. NRRL F-6492]
MTTGLLADDIRRGLGTLTPAERRVARVLLAAYPSAGFETVATVAERAGVSAPTVLRFAARLGYHGYPDFQAALRHELDERNASPVHLYETAGEAAFPRSPDGLMAHSAGLFGSALARTFAEIPPHDLRTAVSLLADRKRRVTLTGGRFTHVLAQYLGLHLMQLREEVRFLPDRDVERAAALTTFGRRDVLVVFDHRRYEDDKQAVARLVRENGGRVIVFTDAWLSPAGAHAEVVLPSRVDTPSPYDSLVPTLAVVETVVADLVVTLGNAAYRRMKHGEEIARRVHLV